MKKKGNNRVDELNNFEGMKLSDSEKSDNDDDVSMSSFSSETSDNSEWKTGSDESLRKISSNHSRKKLKHYTKTFSNFDSCLNANFNYESLRARLASHSKTKQNKKPMDEDLVPITFGLILTNKPTEVDSSTKRTQKVSRSKNLNRKETKYVNVIYSCSVQLINYTRR